MADADVLSTWLTSAAATPKVLTSAAESVGILREAIGVATTAAAQADDTVIRLCRVPSNARISQLLLSCADATTAGKIDIGVWQAPENGGAVVDRDLFASALDLSGGPMDNLECTYESDEYTYAESGLPLWEVLGLTSDPNRDYEINAQVETLFNGGPTTLVLKVRYVI